MIRKYGFFTVLVLTIPVLLGSDYNREVQTRSLLKTDSTSIGQKIEYRNFPNNEVTVMKVIIPPGKETGWHKHPVHVYAYVIQGDLTVEVEGGKTLRFAEDSSFAEVIDTMHTGKNNGAEDVVLIAMYMGEKDKPLTIRKQEPEKRAMP